jgi:hypothetical protein
MTSIESDKQFILLFWQDAETCIADAYSKPSSPFWMKVGSDSDRSTCRSVVERVREQDT